MVRIKQELLDKLAEMEVDALLEGLEDEELKRNPAFLEKVRKFLSQNKLDTQPETPGIPRLIRKVEEIPDFDKIQ